VPPDARAAYSQFAADRKAAVVDAEHRHRSLGYTQLATAAAAAVVAIVALSRGFSVVWAGVPLAAFVALLVVHDRLLRDLERRRRAVAFFERGLARLDGNWPGTGEPGDRYLDPAHPYAQDLDLFGKGSLFELLCSARTRIGQDRLAAWLLAPAPAPELQRRNAAIAELQPRIDLREDLAVVADEAHTGVDAIALAAWGEAPPLLPPNTRRWIPVFTAIGVAALAAMIATGLDWASVVPLGRNIDIAARYVFLGGLLANGFFLHRISKPIDAVIADVDQAAHQLGLISAVLARLEREQFQSPLLAELRARLDVAGEPSSERLAGLKRLSERVDSRDNLFVRMIELFILWTPRSAAAVEEWRRESGASVRRWLEAVGEIEAIGSLASHAFEHPADTFAEIAGGAPCIDADALGHPLIPEDRVVRNDMRLGDGLQVLVVSGSNMSGKSTFLRTVGSNVVLALAGAPVRARRLRLSPLSIGASIRLNDSLQGGVSRFYAEILRIRQILDLAAGALPVLFLIDEFLAGTNSHDRRIGAQALVRGLAERGAIGLVTTHDLALADIADALDGRAANVHFEDQIEDGQIRFDYVMRPGVVRKSNAIELMRSVGLEI
jgi:hypothetical protein